MVSTDELLKVMMANPPDPNEPLPSSNRKATIYGVTVPLLILCWIAVFLRLWVRLRIIREAGWDDFFVALASTLNTAATICVLLSIDYGLGHHFLYIGVENMTTYTKIFYIENALYVTQTSIIKISLLLQYLRIFKAGTMRWICVSLLVIITLWGITYGFMAWIPCFPVHGYWDHNINARCYGYGFADPKEFIAIFQSHTALNMAFDVAVFLTPLVLFTAPNLTRKNLIAMTGVFLLGGGAVMTSVWRLQTIVEHKAATYPYLDFTWWTPISIVLSCVEIDLAIACASTPIFWPVIESKLSEIFVTHEVRITEHRRLDEHGLEYELEHSGSIKSHSMGGNRTSEEGLTREHTGDPFAHYKDQYVVALVDPLASESAPGVGIETEVKSKPQPKWQL
ncbi:hypothetical protein K491DRAFT_686609 [Lophiostoma macrostomum CBS 122681]|uniref:Rhodopsin domain-containing protein n=1 Tax=Lophiostoma macrostomum CBS 122681 TaxID=1314788 RepID=A0A6A6TT80_9PLEO|nr:hypothetical protein K491DRAFT_686609 [Lophiostoma macrostomum CBS 122681]